MSAIQVVLLLFLGYIVFTLDKKQEDVPVPVVLLLLGIGLSFVPFFSSIDVNKELIYDYFLPALLFISAYQYSPKALRKYAWMIGMLSTIGLIFTALALGLFTYAVGGIFTSFTLLSALLIAAILTPTDPVSVVSILKQSSTDEEVADIVEGESMINDGTSVVWFTVLSSMFVKGETFKFFPFLGEFLIVSLGGAAIGLVFGWIVSKAVHFTHHRQYQIMLSIVLTYGSFHLAEHVGVSGVLATVGAGIMLAWEFDHTNKTDHYYESLSSFWDVVEPTVLSLVFLVIGIEATDHLVSEVWVLAGLLFLAAFIIRFFVVGGTMQFSPTFRRHLNLKKSAIISWAGIKGTMSVVLLLSLQADAGSQAEGILSVTFAVIILSIVIQSLGVYPLSKRL
ncbi:Na(+)/H(+) antiporter NhaP [Halobacillus andaensis]|uniref:Na(+)/H(+) antiporter NhaP n=1 Tax=Halobacillus andaensis TaxID=1176239 RepID=A0A917B8Y1_HALAA|nr:sodium:proton antiporter [Halobacillus andaensis]MBP2005347.1 CPA1 family monovalent cation:H+ antiporter [Halobacillus andaensis]GGF30772.1 Na(+)/H(+) antiporter NhaP [Halobacillus andaensis]